MLRASIIKKEVRKINYGISEKMDENIWIEIDGNNLKENICEIKKIVEKKQKIGAILKANAYGHGVEIVTKIIENDVDCIFVVDAEEALRIKKISKSNLRVVVIGSLSYSTAERITKEGIEFAITDTSFFNWPKNIFREKRAKIHLFIDTGLGREGISWNNTALLKKIAQFFENSNIEFIGVMSHFSNAERKGPPEYAKLQLNRFNVTIKSIKDIFQVKRLEKHFAASAPSILYPEARLDMVRMGIFLYGYWTSEETRLGAEILYGKAIELKRALTWKVISRNIKYIPKGDYIGYDCAYLCTEGKYVAIFPVGYYDGYPKLRNTSAWVLINGIRCKILGNVMMNSIVVDISELNLNKNEIISLEAILLGKSGKEEITANMLAVWGNCTNYDVLTSVGSHIKRVIM